jgi:hypothetical protein
MHYIKYYIIIFLTTVGINAQTGIGTTTPAVKLHVKSNGPIFRLEGSDHAYMELFPQGSATRYGFMGFPTANSTQFSFMNQFTNGSLVFGTNGSNRMFLNSEGKLGLGTPTPGTSLHIENGNTFGSPAVTNSPSIYVMNTNNASTAANSTIAVRTAGTGGGKPYYSLDISGAFGYSMGINNPTDQMIINTSWDFNTTAANNAMIINRTGQSRVIIPSSAGSFVTDWPSGWGGGLATFDFSCAGFYYTSLAARSDKRLKNTIENISNEVMAKYLQLRPVSYYWNQDRTRDTKLQYGLIAQEVEPLFPEMVNTGTDEMQTKSVNYQSLHALSLKVIQEQQKQIEILQQKQAALEQRLLLLESKK